MLARYDGVLQREPSEVCIFRVPKFLKDLNEKAYIPQMLSLGPLHAACGHPSTTEVSLGPLHAACGHPSRTDDKLSITEVHKVRAVKRMLDRCHPPKKIEDVIRKIHELERRVKHCYEEAIPYGGDVLAWMLTLDGCFILEILRAASPGFQDYPSRVRFEPIFDGERFGSLQGFLMLRDIMLLENQIPLVVLIKLLKFELGSTGIAREKLWELSDQAFRNLIPFRYNPGEGESRTAIECQLEDIRNSKHLLDWLRTKIISSFLQVEKSSNNNGNCIEHNGCSRLPGSAHENISMPSAEILHNAGIRFRRCIGREPRHIRFIRQSWICGSATLFLPTIRIEDHTETILRNLIAYEECRAESDNRISLYAMFMDDFIETKEDVRILKKEGIICTSIGSDAEVAALFNDLCKGITQRKIEDIDNITSAVKEHYKNKWKVWVGEFVKEHCSNPWLVISLAAGVVLLALTIVQTVFAIIDG